MRSPARARDLLYDPHVRVDVHTHTHTHTHTRTHTHKRAHTHTHTLTHSLTQARAHTHLTAETSSGMDALVRAAGAAPLYLCLGFRV